MNKVMFEVMRYFGLKQGCDSLTRNCRYRVSCITIHTRSQNITTRYIHDIVVVSYSVMFSELCDQTDH